MPLRLIAETPNAGDTGHRFLGSPGHGTSDAEAARLVREARLAGVHVGDDFLAVGRPAVQRFSGRPGREVIVLAGVNPTVLGKRGREDVLNRLSCLLPKLDTAAASVDWRSRAKGVVESEELGEWLKSFASLPEASDSGRRLGRALLAAGCLAFAALGTGVRLASAPDKVAPRTEAGDVADRLGGRPPSTGPALPPMVPAEPEADPDLMRWKERMNDIRPLDQGERDRCAAWLSQVRAGEDLLFSPAYGAAAAYVAPIRPRDGAPHSEVVIGFSGWVLSKAKREIKELLEERKPGEARKALSERLWTPEVRRGCDAATHREMRGLLDEVDKQLDRELYKAVAILNESPQALQACDEYLESPVAAGDKLEAERVKQLRTYLDYKRHGKELSLEFLETKLSAEWHGESKARVLVAGARVESVAACWPHRTTFHAKPSDRVEVVLEIESGGRRPWVYRTPARYTPGGQPAIVKWEGVGNVTGPPTTLPFRIDGIPPRPSLPDYGSSPSAPDR